VAVTLIYGVFGISQQALKAASAQEPVDFNRDVRPILASHCFKCHGPDEKSVKGGLRLDRREAALRPAKSGAVALVPGQPQKSELIRRIFSEDTEEVMPPPSTKHEVTGREREILKSWVAQGAEYREHWAFQPPRSASVPQIPGAGHPIDAFVRDRLAKEGLVPAPAAEPAVLLRRLYLDLIGLPPTVQEADRFLAAYSADAAAAKEAVIDELLASPRYGERWARKWLDLARYADTNGYEKDRTRSIWPYRDWVIRALNADMPFNQFTIEQLAGDMLPNATEEQRVATGFHRNTMLNEEGGIDPLEFRFHAITDRVATTGITWLGLTTGCAQCHTHKYDPILHSEYYQLMAFFNNAEEPDLHLDPASIQQAIERNRDELGRYLAEAPGLWPLPEEKASDRVQGAGKSKVSAPSTPAPKRNQEQIDRATALCEAAFESWISREREALVEWTVLHPASAKSNLPLLSPQADGSVLVSGDISKNDTYELLFRDLPAGITALRLEALPDPSLPLHGPGMAYYEGPKGDFFLGEFGVWSGGSQTANGVPVKVARASESFSGSAFGGRPSSALLATDGDLQTGWSGAGRTGEAIHAVFVLDAPLPAGSEITVRMQFGRHYACSLGKFRLAHTVSPGGAAASTLDPDLQPLLKLPNASWTPEQRASLREQFFLSGREAPQIADRIRALRRVPVLQTSLVLRERPEQNRRPTFIHRRGEFLQPQERVEAGVPAFLPPMDKNQPLNRLGFARWLVSGVHPLTARVTVNRHWHAFFGAGLVRTVGDFGYQGETPTHPELLDWLAQEFVRQGWSTKKLHRLLVTSETYAQASRVTEQMLERDPANRLLARGPRFRVDAETVRDSVLAASGLLSEKMFGPPVYPPQPPGVQEVAYGGAGWSPSKGEDRYRRSIYTFLKRSAPFAMYNTFDAPAGEVCVARREVSNTPLQSLTLLNDEMFLEAARRVGADVAAMNASDAQKMQLLFRRCLTRHPTEREMSRLLDFVTVQRSRIQSGSLNASELSPSEVPGTGLVKSPAEERAVWVVTARALLNLDEFVTKN
jgi:mono/diheme cytochrome c family protein